MADTPNEQIIIDERFMEFRSKRPFCVFIKTKPGMYGIKLWVAADAKNFYACNMQVYTGKSGGGEAGPSGCKRYGLSHVWNWKRYDILRDMIY